MLVAPSLTTSVSWVMVLAEEWAAWASFSWVDAAPATSSLVSSTSALAVFKMLSLRTGTHCVTICSTVTLENQQYERKTLLIWTECVFSKDIFQLTFIMQNASEYSALLANCTSTKWVIKMRNEALGLQCKNLPHEIFSCWSKAFINIASRWKVVLPVVSKRLFVVRVQCSSGSKHDGGV